MKTITGLFARLGALLLLLIFVLLTGRTYAAQLHIVNATRYAAKISDDVGVMEPTIVPAGGERWVTLETGPYGNTILRLGLKTSQYGSATFGQWCDTLGPDDKILWAFGGWPDPSSHFGESLAYMDSDGLWIYDDDYHGTPPSGSGAVGDTVEFPDVLRLAVIYLTTFVIVGAFLAYVYSLVGTFFKIGKGAVTQ